jgi:hypothetical protein
MSTEQCERPIVPGRPPGFPMRVPGFRFARRRETRGAGRSSAASIRGRAETPPTKCARFRPPGGRQLARQKTTARVQSA